MNQRTKKEVEQLVAQEDIEFIRLQFTDIFGIMKNVAITSSQLDKAFQNKVMFNGWAVHTEDHAKSAHFELTVVVRKGQAELLSTFDFIEKNVKF